MNKACYYCHIKTLDQLIEKHKLSAEQADNLTSSVYLYLQHNWNLSNPLIATTIQRIAKEQLKVEDLYIDEKQAANTLLLNSYDKWKQLITNSKNPFQTAAKLAVIGNIIDYGAHSVPDELEDFISQQIHQQLAIDHSDALKQEILKAKSIVYLGDNNGEIVFDKLFIECIAHPSITFVTRGSTVLNDITIEDAKNVGIDQCCQVMSNGYDAPSTIMNYCSAEFQLKFEEADLIISKGQGNFEGIMDITNKNIFLLLMAKCDVIAEILNVSKGSMIIKQQNILQNEL
ncbi:MAG: DUF89 domain-containing protein [Prolixibacteraceae bacterium]